jgi:hypothetical protein
VLDSTTSYLPAYTCASLHCTLIAADLHVLQVSRDDTAFSAILPPFSMTAGAINFLTIYSLDEFKLKRTSGGNLFYVMPSGTSGSFLAEFFDGDPSWSLPSSTQFEMHHSIDFESNPGDFSYSAIRWTGYLSPNVNAIFRSAGVANKRVVFMYTDSQIKFSSMLEGINNILNTGEVPNLFPSDELQQVLDGVLSAAKEAKQASTPASIFKFFVSQCRKNLHMVLCFSPVGDGLRNRLHQFPSLVNCCTID